MAGESYRLRVVLGRLVHTQACLLLMGWHFDSGAAGFVYYSTITHRWILERSCLSEQLGIVLVIYWRSHARFSFALHFLDDFGRIWYAHVILPNFLKPFVFYLLIFVIFVEKHWFCVVWQKLGFQELQLPFFLRVQWKVIGIQQRMVTVYSRRFWRSRWNIGQSWYHRRVLNFLYNVQRLQHVWF